jgi:hypothetical protein
MRCKEGAKCSICKYPSGYYIWYAYEQMHKYLIKKSHFLYGIGLSWKKLMNAILSVICGNENRDIKTHNAQK